jgi:ParB family chromosome partitioning protein
MATAQVVQQEFKMIPLEKVHESSTNPRKSFDAKALADLVASVKEKGVIVPVLVRPTHGGTVGMSERFELVAGARRLRAAKTAGLYTIPAIVRELSDEAALEAQVIENLQRADVHPLEEAEGYKVLMARAKYEVETIAAKVGKSISYVYQRLKLCELIEPAKKSFLSGGITAGHAVLIARLQPSDQVEALKLGSAQPEEFLHEADRHVKLSVPVRTLADWIQNNIHMSLDGAPWKKDDAELLPKAGPCTTCPKRAGNSPELFSDVPRAQTCTDRTCFNAKLAAHMGRLAKELEAAGKEVVKLSVNWNAPEKDVLNKNQYTVHAKNKKRCQSMKVGFYVDGEKRGQTADVCVAETCKIHKPGYSSYRSSSSSSSGVDAKANEQRIIKERATDRARLVIFEKVIRATKAVTRQDLELLAAASQGLPYLDGAKDPDWMPPACDSTAAAKKASDKDLAQFLVATALGEDLGHYGDARFLLSAAARHRIDVKAIEKEAVRQVTHERLHHAKRMAWKGRAAADAKSFDELTCTGCGRKQADQAKGGWHWVKKVEKTKAALCNDCEREENEKQ